MFYCFAFLQSPTHTQHKILSNFHVIVIYLLRQPDLNGCTGVCFDDRAGRWLVRFDTVKSVVSIQPKNMRVQVPERLQMQSLQLILVEKP